MISIITPVLNGERFIRNILDSVSQLTIDYEHVIVDGGSSDGTVSICLNYPKVRVLQQDTRQGMYGAIQQGFDNSRGDWLCWINCDDWINVDNFSKLYENTIKSGHTFGYGSAQIVDSRIDVNSYVGSKCCGRFLLRNGVFPFIQPSSLYHRSLVLLVGGLDYEQFSIAGDIDFFIRISRLKEFSAYRSKEICTYFFKYGDSLGDRGHKKYLAEKLLLPKPQHGIVGRLLAKIIYHVS